MPLPSWLGNLVNGASDPALTTPEDQQRAAQRRLAMAASFLAGSGPSVAGTRGGLQPLGEALQAGQAADQNASELALKRRMVLAQIARAQTPDNLIGSASPSDFTPDSLAKYQQTRNPADLVPVEKNMFGRFQPRDYTPESLTVFEQTHNPGDLRRVANFQPQTLPGGGIGSYDPVTGQLRSTPVSNEDAQVQAAALSRAKAQATAEGEATGKAQGAILTKALNAGNIMSILDMADPLIDEATGSGTGAGRDALAAFFGFSTTGAQAIASLKPLQAAIMLNQPRMEGPQSDADVKLYREAAGQIGDPTVPGPTKKAALKTVRALQEKYAEKGTAGSSPKRVKVDAQGNVIAP